MTGMKILKWLVVLAGMWLLAAGCADGVLFQKESANGRVDRLRIDGAEGWGDYDTTPRYRSSKPKDQDGYGLVLKNEATF